MPKPLVYFGVSLFLGCFFTFLFFYIFYLGAVMAAFFLIIMLFTVEKNYILQIFIFFVIGVMSVLIYFNIDLNTHNLNKVRIIEKNSYYVIGSYKGRKVVISGNLNNINEGQEVALKGNFIKENNYSKGILGTFNVKSYKILKGDFITKINIFKNYLFYNFSKRLDKDKTAFIMAICFGDTNYLNSEQKYNFQKLGVIHAISVSGFHLAVIYKVIEKIVGIYPSIIISLLYVVFTGAKPPTVRAFLMIFILKLSKKFNKRYDSLSALALSAMLILVFKPFYVLDIGFILSYLATLSIILFNKRISRKLIFLPVKLNEAVSMSISSQILSLPYAAFCIKNISTGFMLGNIILLPLYTAIVILGNGALIFVNVKIIFSLLCKVINFVLVAIDGATSFLLSVSPPMKYFTYIDSYILCFFILSIILGKKGIKKSFIIPLALSLVLIFENYSFFPEVIYFNYGKSDSVVIKYKKSVFLITDETGSKKIQNIKSEFKTTEVISARDGNNILRLGNKYKVNISEPQYYKDKAKTMQVEFYYDNKKILFARKNEIQAISMNNKKYYDIIILPENIKSEPLDFNTTNTHCYLIIFGKIIKTGF